MKSQTNSNDDVFVPIKTEFLKWIIGFIITLVTTADIAAYTLMAVNKDLSALGEITLANIGLLSAILAFYTGKAIYDHKIGYRHGYWKSGMSVDEVIKMTNIKINEEEEY